MYGIPPERVIGSSTALDYQADERAARSLRHGREADVFDDGPVKPVRIWSRIGRRPILAAGNSNGDIPMLEFTGRPARPALRLLVLHDDAEREFDYTAGAEKALERAGAESWTVISIKNDWTTVFAEADERHAGAPRRPTAEMTWIPDEASGWARTTTIPRRHPAHRVTVAGFWIDTHRGHEPAVRRVR